MLTPCDTPTTNAECEDYQRIKRVAEARTRTRSSNGSERYPDGVQRQRGLERLNYVALNGAHRLNMTRAFGNFGHKEWRGTAAVESASPVIARPHLAAHLRTGREQFLVIGSDGLWDNLSHGAVSAILRKHAWPVGVGPAGQEEPAARSCDWGRGVAQRAAQELIDAALRVNKKADDITCVVVVFV